MFFYRIAQVSWLVGSACIAGWPAHAVEPLVDAVAQEQLMGQWQVVTVTHAGRSYPVSVRAPAATPERLPVILFLHGAGERGDDLQLVRSVGLPRLAQNRPHILVVPQVPENGWWSDRNMMAVLMTALESVVARWGGDRNRVYLTGLSMGGHGALQLAARYPDYFAAVLAICPRLGRPSYVAPLPGLPVSARELARRLQQVPLWLFHGDSDEVVPVTNSRRLARALSDLGADSRYTEVPGGLHNIWQQVYTRSVVMDWLFSNRRP